MPTAARSTTAATRGTAKPLVIVESPAKARTIGALLGPEFVVESSVGHIRDLPRRAGDVPPAYKGEGWARLGVDVDNGFKPLYVVSADKRDVVSRLRALLKQASELYLATDEDREGESIAWHLTEVLAPKVPVKRMVFHEITPAAIERAVQNWRDLDRRLVDAQEARRILDRLYGYEVSPVLWKKVMPRLSAGRVQSVATRMIVERERDRMRFRAANWWDLEGAFEVAGPGTRGGATPTEGTVSSEEAEEAEERRLRATLVSVGGTAVATGRDFSETGELKSSGLALLDEPVARELARALQGQPFQVRSVTEKPYRRSPAPPFMTSTLQQEAGRKLRFGAQRTMQVAQRLYEQGWITYMRTDSTTLSDEALAAARGQAAQLYGERFVPERPRRYERKVKNAQEAHEAIRPAGETFRTPEEAAAGLRGDALKLYELIWKRSVASQMTDATGTSAQVRLVGIPAESSGVDGEAEFAAAGTVITFPGFLRAYVEGSDDPDAEVTGREVRLPALSEGRVLEERGIEPKSHATQPPARYTEASLVKALEELGVGRPSTYASILSTIQDRGYVWKRGTALVPSFTAFAVVGLLERHFGDLVDYGFTAAMEDDLDAIAQGDTEALPWLTRFYFGEGIGEDAAGSEHGSKQGEARAPNGSAAGSSTHEASNGQEHRGLKAEVAAHLGQIDAREVNSIPIGTDEDGRQIVVRVGRYGPYLQRGEERAGVPEGLAPDELTIPRAEELLQAPSGDRTLGVDPGSGLPVLVRSGRFGPYVQLGEADGSGRPRTSSLFKSMDPDTLTLPEALSLLSLPRVVGTDPASGEEITASNGRFGPYLKKGSDTRSLDSEEQLLAISLEEALDAYARPRVRGGRAAAAPLRELGPDPENGLPMVVRVGRYGPYVTDGTTNASLRRGDEPEAITAERAAELLAERRAAGPPVRRARRTVKAKQATKATKAKKATKAEKATNAVMVTKTAASGKRTRPDEAARGEGVGSERPEAPGEP